MSKKTRNLRRISRAKLDNVNRHLPAWYRAGLTNYVGGVDFGSGPSESKIVIWEQGDNFDGIIPGRFQMLPGNLRRSGSVKTGLHQNLHQTQRSPPKWRASWFSLNLIYGAEDRIRTRDPLFTKQLLYP